MSDVLVTGADGFIGRRLVSRLRSEGCAVATISLAPEPIVHESRAALDLAEPAHLAALAASGARYDTVIHLAARVEIRLAPGVSPNEPPVPAGAVFAPLYRDNLLATVHLVDFCLRTSVRHLVFASSQAVYGHPVERPLTEHSACRPLEHYAASKLCAEQMLMVASAQGLAVTVLRLSGAFAEDRLSGVVTSFADQAVSLGRITVKADYPLPLDVIHVDDAVDAFVRAVGSRSPGFRCLNVSTGEPCSLTLLAERIAAHVEGCAVSHDGPTQPIVQCDNTAARRELGWNPVAADRRYASMVAAARARKARA